MVSVAARVKNLFGLFSLHKCLAFDHPYEQVHVEDIPFWPLFYPAQCNPIVNYSNATNKTHCELYKSVTTCTCMEHNSTQYTSYTNTVTYTNYSNGTVAANFTNLTTTNCTIYGNCTNASNFSPAGYFNTTVEFSTVSSHETSVTNCACVTENVSYIDYCPNGSSYDTNETNKTNHTVNVTDLTDIVPLPKNTTPDCTWYNVQVNFSIAATNLVNAANVTNWIYGWDCPEPEPVNVTNAANGTSPIETETDDYTKVCYALCKLPHIKYGVSKWDGRSCEDFSQNVTEGTRCGITPKPGYICENPGVCGHDHYFENQHAACRVELRLTLEGVDYDSFTANHDTVAFVTEYLKNLTSLYYEVNLQTALSADYVKVTFSEEAVMATIDVYPPDTGVDVLPGVVDIAKSSEYVDSVYNAVKGFPGTAGFTHAQFLPSASILAVDCVGTWKRWQPCDSRCGAGKKKRHYRVIRPASVGGKDCDATSRVTDCWSGPCPTPGPPTFAPTQKKTSEPTPAPPCKSASGKSDQQCLKKCNEATDCPFTCRFCSEECACTLMAIQKKDDYRDEKKETKTNHRKNGAPTPTPTARPTPTPTSPCTSSNFCERTSFCWSGQCRNTRDAMVCMDFDGMASDDGWTWESMSTDPNFMCDVEDKCKSWCSSHTSPWEKKCEWEGCKGCAQCQAKQKKRNSKKSKNRKKKASKRRKKRKNKKKEATQNGRRLDARVFDAKVADGALAKCPAVVTVLVSSLMLTRLFSAP